MRAGALPCDLCGSAREVVRLDCSSVGLPRNHGSWILNLLIRAEAVDGVLAMDYAVTVRVRQSDAVA